jgi:HK97 gp10 family phage protein
MAKYEIKGLSELQKKLSKLKGIKDAPQAMLAGAQELQRLSMENAPVKTGNLKNSHYSRMTDSGAEMVVGAEYAGYVEFGTSKWSGKPFVRPAIDEGKNEIVKAVEEGILKELEKAEKG